MIRLLKSLRYLVVLALLLTGSACTNMIFQPMAQQFYTPDIANIVWEELFIESDPGLQLHGWRLISKVPRKGNVLFLHGNGENITSHFVNVYWLVDHGYDVYLFDYRGYGRSDGVAELDGVIRDVDAMLSHMQTITPPNQELVILGHSMGGALAIHGVANMPQKAQFSALVAVEAFSDYRDVTREVLDKSWITWLIKWPVSLTINNSYSPMRSIAQVSPVPLLIMHSRQDQIIDFYHATRLYEQAQLPKQFIEVEGGHNQVFQSNSNRRLLLEYLEGL